MYTKCIYFCYLFCYVFVFSRKKPWLIFSISLVALQTNTQHEHVFVSFSWPRERALLCAHLLTLSLYLLVTVYTLFFLLLFLLSICSLFIFFYLVLFVRLDSVNLLNVYDRTIIHGHTHTRTHTRTRNTTRCSVH